MAEKVRENMDLEIPNENDAQSPQERRQIRKKYRNFIDDLHKNKEDLVNPESDELYERLEEAEELFKPVKRAREVALDSHAIGLIANMGRMKANALHTEFVHFQPVEFAEKLITFVGGQRAHAEGSRISALGWAKLGKATQPFFNRSPIFQFMVGSFERGPKPVKEVCQPRTKDKDNVVGKETIPKQLKNFDESEKSEATTEEVERVYDILKTVYREEDDSPLCFFEFVLNPTSFGQTVENIFHISFLIRDGLAEVLLDDDKLPVIKPVIKPEGGGGDKGAKKEQRRHQTIISITPQEWRDLVTTFKVENPSIPPRTSENTVTNGHSQR